jgi:predicted metalloendopeptidase
MDRAADPCNDFYQFACGGFIEKTVIPEDKPGVSMFSIIRDKLDLQVS